MVVGVHFALHLCAVALSIDGVKHPLARVQRSAENTTLVRCLLVGFRERGLHVRDYPPKKMRRVPRRMRKVYHANCTLVAGALLRALAKELDKVYLAPLPACVGWPQHSDIPSVVFYSYPLLSSGLSAYP